MCNSKLHPFLVSLPKCEHHIHMEGSLTPSLLFRLAAKHNISLPPDPAFASIDALYARYQTFSSLEDFLGFASFGFNVLLTAADFEELGWEYFTKAAAQNVRHAEVFFDPQAHTSRGIAYETVVAGLTAARRRAESELGMSVGLVACFLRHYSVPDGMKMFETVRDAGHFEDGTVAGLGMSSVEIPYPPEMFKPIYDAARAAGVRRTAHAGEVGPPSYVRGAIEHLDVQRIDHGLRAAEDPEVVKFLAEKGVMLTMCPISNVMLRCVERMEDVPIRTFLDAGVKFSINSDNPGYLGMIQGNYCAVQEAFGLTLGEWEGIARVAVEGSWCTEERKGMLMREVEGVVGEWRAKIAA